MPEVNRLEPLDADEDLVGFVSPRQVQFLALWRTGADIDRVELFRIHQRLQARDGRVVLHLDAHVHDVADFFVEHFFGEAEGGDVDAHQAARARPFFEDGALVPQRHQVVRHGEGGRTGADEGHLLAVLRSRSFRDAIGDVVLVIGGHALQAADRDGLAVDASTPARRLARTVAGAAQDAREHVRLAIQDVGIVELAVRDHPDVFRNVGVRGARPLTVDDLMVVIRVRSIRPLHIAEII